MSYYYIKWSYIERNRTIVFYYFSICNNEYMILLVWKCRVGKCCGEGV